MIRARTMIVDNKVYAIVQDFIDKSGAFVYGGSINLRFRDIAEAISYLQKEDKRRSIEHISNIFNT